MSGDLAPTVAEHGARLDALDRDVVNLRAEDERIERTLSAWLSSLDKKFWAIVIGVGLSLVGMFGSLITSLLIYAAIGKARP